MYGLRERRSRVGVVSTLASWLNSTRIASRRRIEQQDGSDIDILVDVEPSIGLRFVTLANELERLLDERVELVSSRAVGPRMKPLIEADCIEVA